MCVSGGQRTVMSSSKTSQRLFCIRRENPFTLNGQEGEVFSLHQSQSNYIWILHGGIMGGNDEWWMMNIALEVISSNLSLVFFCRSLRHIYYHWQMLPSINQDQGTCICNTQKFGTLKIRKSSVCLLYCSSLFSLTLCRFITGSYDRTCRVWDTASGTELHKLEGHRNVVYTVAFNNPYG